MTKKLVVCAMSGGIDSSVTAYLLLRSDDWDDDSKSSLVKSCSVEKDWQSVQQVCSKLGIPRPPIFKSFSSQYWTRVFEPYIQEMQSSGRVGNPDVACNREIKFGSLYEWMCEEFGPNVVLATGHYARITNFMGKGCLARAKDLLKDQSFFLSSLKPSLFAGDSVMFPLGSMDSKDSVRDIARLKMGMPELLERRSSSGICFVGKRNRHGDFMEQYLAVDEGSGGSGSGGEEAKRSCSVVDVETGKVVASLPAASCLSLVVGQRARIPGQLYYVISKNVSSLTVSVSKDKYHPWLFTSSLILENFKLLVDDLSDLKGNGVRVFLNNRDRAGVAVQSVSTIGDGEVLVRTERSVYAPMNGQQAVLYYQNEICLGGGKIK